MVVDGTQFIEYPDGQTKAEIPYKDDDKKAWINVKAYNICVQEDTDLTRETMANSGDLPEQQDNEAAAAEKGVTKVHGCRWNGHMYGNECAVC
jgi:hypothetical protein